MTAVRLLLRLVVGVGRFFDVIDKPRPPKHEWQPDIGSDDDTTALADSLNDNPHLDPNRHWQQVGCLICRDTLAGIRATVAAGVPFDWQLWEIEGGWTVAGDAS